MDRMEACPRSGSVKAVGERLHYVATDAQDQWLALLVFSAPAKHLKHRDQWIGWRPAPDLEALKRWANASTTWPPMPKISGWPCWFSVLQPSTSNIATNGSDGVLHRDTGA